MIDSRTTLGSYRIVETLGQGGMGVVYRAVHQHSGEQVALKTVPLPNTSLLQSLRREIHALARIRHPGIVPILDTGLEDGLPWYAMELLDGQSLQQILAQLWEGSMDPSSNPAFGLTVQRPLAEPSLSATPPLRWTQAEGGIPRTGLSAKPPEVAPEPAGTEAHDHERATLLSAAGGMLPAVLGLAHRLFEALAFLHGEGIVHRDLKPANILIRIPTEGPRPTGAEPGPSSRLVAGHPLARWVGGQPVLVDFGGSTRFWGGISRESLEGVDCVVGTAGYMAPEQIQGELVDPRADLYAMGCILYELVTGRRPFLGKTEQSVLRKHLEEAPLRPSALVTDLPPELEDLILRLMAKRPRDRLGYADDAARSLVRLGAEAKPMETPKARPFLHRADLAGRGEPLQRFEEALRGLTAGQGRTLLLAGESGIGKTRVAMEVSRLAQRAGMHVLSGECLPLAASGTPLHPLRKALQAVADRCRELGPAETARLVAGRAVVLGKYEPAFLLLPGVGTGTEPAELPAEAAKLRLFQYLVEVLSLLAEDRPVVLILDDLQWADELTMGLLDLLTRTISGGPGRAQVLLVGTYRTEDVGEEERAPLRRLMEAPGVTVLPLGRLEAGAVARMIGDMLGMASPPEGLAHFLTEQSEGNAFFVAEYLRTAIAEGILYRDGAGRWHVTDPAGTVEPQDFAALLSLPASLRELVGRRLEGLHKEARCVLEAAAVLGREPELETVLETACLPDDGWMEALTELLRRQVVELVPGGRLRFLHDKLREVACELLAPRRREVHRAAAEALQGLGQRGAGGENDAVLAHHWEEAGVPHLARGHALAGARNAAARHAHLEAERLYRAVLRLQGLPDAVGVEARNELGSQVLLPEGRLFEAVEEHRVALEQAEALGDRAAQCTSARLLGDAYRGLGQHEEARGRLEQALELCRAVGDRKQECRILPALAGVHFMQGRGAVALDLVETAIAIARETGDAAAEATCLANLAIVRSQEGHLEEAKGLMRQALELHRAAGNQLGEGRTLYNLAVLHVFQGQLETSRGLYEQAIAVHRESGDRYAEAIDLENMANLYQKMGQLELAGRGFEQAIAALQRVGNRGVEGCACSNFGDLRLQQGRVEEARELYLKALSLHREVGDVRSEGVTTLSLALLERRMGRLEEATRLASEAGPVVERGGDRLHLVLCRCDQGHIELAHGRPARQLLEQARSLAEELGLGPQSEGGLSLARLERAVAADEQGMPLFRGELPEDLPEALRSRLQP